MSVNGFCAAKLHQNLCKPNTKQDEKRSFISFLLRRSQIYLKFAQVERKTKTFLSFSETQPNLSKICASRTQIARDKDHQKIYLMKFDGI